MKLIFYQHPLVKSLQFVGNSKCLYSLPYDSKLLEHLQSLKNCLIYCLLILFPQRKNPPFKFCSSICTSYSLNPWGFCPFFGSFSVPLCCVTFNVQPLHMHCTCSGSSFQTRYTYFRKSISKSVLILKQGNNFKGFHYDAIFGQSYSSLTAILVELCSVC